MITVKGLVFTNILYVLLGNPQPSGSLNFSNLETAELKYRLLRKTLFEETTVRVSSPFNDGVNEPGDFPLNTDTVTTFDGFISSGDSRI